jgi:hypothetical protein
MRRYRSNPLCMKVAPCLVSALAVLQICGCGGAVTSPAVPSPTGGGSLQQNIVSAPVLGFAWDSKALALREIDGVPGAARVDASAGSGAGFATAVAAGSRAYALLLDSKGALYLTLLPGGVPRQLASGPWSGLAISASGEYAVAYSATGAASEVIGGLPQQPALRSADVQGIGIAAAAVSDTGAVLLATKPGGSGTGILAIAPGAVSASRVLSLGAMGGLAFVPGTDRALVADAATGTVTQLDHVCGVPTPSLLSGSTLPKSVGLDVSADGRWVLMANGSGTIVRLDLNGQTPPSSTKCNCAPTTVANLSGSAFRLTDVGSSTGWMVEAGGNSPRVLFIPALPGQKIAGGGQ